MIRKPIEEMAKILESSILDNDENTIMKLRKSNLEYRIEVKTLATNVNNRNKHDAKFNW